MAKSGPNTEAGKKIVSLNAVKHGVFSTTPVIPGIEREEDWEAHLGGILESLAPEGLLEVKLTRRTAALLWRLERLERYETDSISLAHERVEEDVATARFFATRAAGGTPGLLNQEDVADDLEFERQCLRLLECLPALPDDAPIQGEDAADILSTIARYAGHPEVEEFSFPGVPDDVTVQDFTGWTASLVRRGIAAIAGEVGSDPDNLLTHATVATRMEVSMAQREAHRVARDLDRERRGRLLPDESTLEKVVRYEAHLNRQLNQTLHELEALQARRQGGVTPLARVDVQGLRKN